MTATRIWSLTAVPTGPPPVPWRRQATPLGPTPSVLSQDGAWHRPGWRQSTILPAAPRDEEVVPSLDQSTLLSCSKVRIQSNGQEVAVARRARAGNGRAAAGRRNSGGTGRWREHEAGVARIASPRRSTRQYCPRRPNCDWPGVAIAVSVCEPKSQQNLDAGRR